MRPGFEEVAVLEEGVKAAQAEAEEDAAGKGASALTGDEHVGAGGAFGIGQCAVLLHNELAAQGNHEEHALRTVECARAAQRNRLEIGRSAAVQSFFERSVSSQIHQANSRLQNPFRIGSALIGVAAFVSIIDLRWCWRK